MPNTPPQQQPQPTTGKFSSQSAQTFIAAFISLLGGTGAFYGNKAIQGDPPAAQVAGISDKDRERLDEAVTLVGQMDTRLDALEVRLNDHKSNVATNVTEIKGDVRAIRSEQGKLHQLLTTIAANLPK